MQTGTIVLYVVLGLGGLALLVAVVWTVVWIRRLLGQISGGVGPPRITLASRPFPEEDDELAGRVRAANRRMEKQA